MIGHEDVLVCLTLTGSFKRCFRLQHETLPAQSAKYPPLLGQYYPAPLNGTPSGVEIPSSDLEAFSINKGASESLASNSACSNRRTVPKTLLIHPQELG